MERCDTSVQKLTELGRRWADRDFLYQTVLGLNHLHAMNIIHRDIKPSNVLVSRDIQNMYIPKLADFGISKIACAEDNETFAPGSLKRPTSKLAALEERIAIADGRDTTLNCRGSPGWIATELCHPGPAKYSKAVDVFATGCLFYYIMTQGQHPFHGTRPKLKLDLSVCHYNIVRYGRGESKYDLTSIKQNLKDLIERMIEKEPVKRLSTTDVMAHPFFWDAEKALNYIISNVNNKLKPETPKDNDTSRRIDLIRLLEHESHVITEGNWKAKLSPAIQKNIDCGEEKYDSSSIFDLLLCICDKVSSSFV